jgi:hypothetical protein
MSRSASQFGVGGDILSDNRAKLADAYNLGRAHQMDLSHGGHPDIQFEMSPDIHDHDINPRIAARKKEIERKLRAGQAVPLSDEEAKRSLDDPRAAPPDTYYSEEPGGIARTVTGPRAAPHTYSLPAQMMTVNCRRKKRSTRSDPFRLTLVTVLLLVSLYLLGRNTRPR